jgi:hypothetical protein
MRQLIPNFVVPSSPSDTRRLTSAASVPQQFVELTAVAVTNNAMLVRGGAVNPVETRDLLSYAEAYAPLADELEALAHFIRHSVATAKNKAGSEALIVYALAQRLATRPETADLAPHVADMRRALGRANRKPKPQPQPAPTPATPVRARRKARPRILISRGAASHNSQCARAGA